jgi:small GTP-binding protein
MVSKMSKGSSLLAPVQKVVLMGNAGVGKTSLFQSVSRPSEAATDTTSTMGVDFVYVPFKDIRLQLWDTAGQERFLSITKAYVRGADCCIFVFDVTDRASFQRLSRLLSDVMESKSSDAQMKFVMVGNKVDLPPHLRQITKEEAVAFAAANMAMYVETNAKDASSVEAMFTEVAKYLTATSATSAMERPRGALTICGGEGSVRKHACCILG